MADTVLRLALPKGRMQRNILDLLADAGLPVRMGERDYRPTLAVPWIQAKLLKPHNIVEMLHAGSRDAGFCGADWVAELDCDLVDVLDTELDPVRLVAAAPNDLLENGGLPRRPIVVASEYERLTKRWIAERGFDDRFVKSSGATEVFPPEDADCIVDNTQTGSTLRANGLTIVGEVMRSSTRLFANPRALEDRARRDRIEHIAVLLRSVLEARRRVMLELNVAAADLESVVAALPCLREPTISQLHGEAGYAVKAAVPRRDLAELIPRLRRQGGSDLVITEIAQLVP